MEKKKKGRENLFFFISSPTVKRSTFLNPIVSPLTFPQVDSAVQEREQYSNVTRWFDHIQHFPGVQRHLPPVAVLRNRIYTGRHH